MVSNFIWCHLTKCVGIGIINYHWLDSLGISQEVAHLPEEKSCMDNNIDETNEPCENLIVVMFPEARDCLAELEDDLFPFPKSHSEYEYSEFVSPSKLHHLKRRGRCHVNLVSLSSFILNSTSEILYHFEHFFFSDSISSYLQDEPIYEYIMVMSVKNEENENNKHQYERSVEFESINE